MSDTIFTIIWFISGATSSFLAWRFYDGKEFNLIHLFLCLLGTFFAVIPVVILVMTFLSECSIGNIKVPILWKRKPIDIDIDRKIKNIKKNLFDRKNLLDKL